MTTRLVFIVPAYNEQESLPAVVHDLREHYPAAEVVVINDGSTDGTAGIARFLGVTLLDLPYNLGIGGTVQTGLLFAAREGHDVAVQFDGDGQHRADQVARLLRELGRGGCDAVIGSRFLGPSGYRAPLARRVGIAVFRAVNSLVLGRTITDSTSGFRAYNRAAISFLARDYPHDYPEPESVVTLCRHGFEVREVAVEMRERQGGRSSITLWRSLYYMCKVILAIAVGATRRAVGRTADELASADRLDPR
ncbi:MAG TPA: glycosyltransferase family 2 protein [Blastocatellia bacterium]|nr:glycosyltransferase family 2 protein [Blastocatellia bacterium]